MASAGAAVLLVLLCIARSSTVLGGRSFTPPLEGEIEKLLLKETAYADEEVRPNRQVPRPVEVTNWPEKRPPVGQISGVAVNSRQQPVVLHRGSRVWDALSFDAEDNFLQRADGPVTEDTLLTLDPATGSVLDSWGARRFYLPHGLTLDRHDNVWITDVAMHQVFKFIPGQEEPSIVFGRAFDPGHDLEHLCKPTSVAVALTGEIFIADGYCNSRILLFNAGGALLREIAMPEDQRQFEVPHSLALFDREDKICVADRENMRAVCLPAGLQDAYSGGKARVIQEDDTGRLFAIAPFGGLIFGVNGPTSANIPVQGLTMDVKTSKVLDRWEPTTDNFRNPHAIAVSHDGRYVYVGEYGPNRLWKFEITSDMAK